MVKQGELVDLSAARKPEIKREYIDVVYKMLVEEGIENVSARELGRRMGKSTAAVYRHFESLDYLIGLASVRYLNPYYDLLVELATDTPNPLDLCLQTWEAFAYYAFRDIPIFENLFFGPARGGKFIEEYYEYFPEERARMRRYIEAVVDSTDLVERGRFLHSRAAEEGYIALQDVEYLLNIDVLTLRGLFQEYRNRVADDAMVNEAVSRFSAILYRTYKRALLPGKDFPDTTNERYANVALSAL